MTNESTDMDTFSPDEMSDIRLMLDFPDGQPECPRCQSILKQDGPVAGGGSVGLVWHMSCSPCNVEAFVAESMARGRGNEIEL